ncbi:MAG: RNA polymerase sigma factor [Pseudomonadota bacterium]
MMKLLNNDEDSAMSATIQSDTTLHHHAAALTRLYCVTPRELQRFARVSCTTSEVADGPLPFGLRQVRRKLGTRRVLRAVSTWMIGQLESVCLRLVQVSRPSAALNAILLEELPYKPMALDLRKDLNDAILALPPIYRTALILRDVEELSTPDAAGKLGISIDAFKSRLHRARRMLRESMTGNGYWFGAIR